MIVYILIILIILAILSLFKYLLNYENFKSINIKSVINNLDNEKNKAILKSVDKTIKKTKDEFNTNFDTENDFLNDYIKNKLINNELNEYKDTNSHLKMGDLNNKEYIHKLNILKSKKEIRQNFILSILKMQILKLKNKTLNIEDLRKKKLLINNETNF